MTRTKRPPVKTCKRHAEILCRRITFHRASTDAGGLPVCECCYLAQATDWAHLVKRRYSVTRCDPLNTAALCRPCHEEIDRSPVSMLLFVKATIGIPAYERLERRAHDGLAALNMTAGAFWSHQLEVLKGQCCELGLSTKWRAA